MAHQEVVAQARVVPRGIVDVIDSFEELPAQSLGLGAFIALHLLQLIAGGFEADAGRCGVAEGAFFGANADDVEVLVVTGRLRCCSIWWCAVGCLTVRAAFRRGPVLAGGPC